MNKIEADLAIIVYIIIITGIFLIFPRKRVIKYSQESRFPQMRIRFHASDKVDSRNCPVKVLSAQFRVS